MSKLWDYFELGAIGYLIFVGIVIGIFMCWFIGYNIAISISEHLLKSLLFIIIAIGIFFAVVLLGMFIEKVSGWLK